MTAEEIKQACREVHEKAREMLEYYGAEENGCNKVDCKECPLLNNNCDIAQRVSMENMIESIDIVMNWQPTVAWSKVAVDTPILVRDTDGEEWIKRHFAKYENGMVYAWDDGVTSWTYGEENDGTDMMTAWFQAKLAEGEQT